MISFFHRKQKKKKSMSSFRCDDDWRILSLTVLSRVVSSVPVVEASSIPTNIVGMLEKRVKFMNSIRLSL